MWTAWRCRSDRTPSQPKAFNSYVLVRYCLIFIKQKALHVEGFFWFLRIKTVATGPEIRGLQRRVEKGQNCRNCPNSWFDPML